MKPTSPAELSKWILKLLCSTRLILDTLKIGPSVNIFIGEPGNDYAAIESAYATLLSHFSLYRRKKLAINPVSVSISTSATRTLFYLSTAGYFQVNGIVTSKEPLNSRV